MFKGVIERINDLFGTLCCVCKQLHKPLAFSTSPFSRYTHWKQTVLYLRDPLTVCSGEHVQGSISSRPNERNPRDLDITVSIDFEGKHCQTHLTQEFRLR